MSISRRLPLIAPLALAILPLACEDAGVAESGQAQAQLAAARTAYLEVVANRPTTSVAANLAGADDEEARQIEAFAALRSQTDRALSGIANEISPLASGGNAAAGLMLAEVKLDQAKLRMQDLFTEAGTTSAARRAVFALARAAADLDAAAAANDSMRLPAADALRRAAGEARRAAASEQAVIETERRSAERLAESIESFRRRAGELNADALELQRRASAQNPIDAYDLIAESADLRRMANELAVEAAGQEIAFEVQEDAIRDRDRERLGLEAQAAGRDQAATLVSEISAALASQSSTFRQAATEIRQRLVPAAAAIELGAESVFGQAAAAARSDFEAAAAAARRARSGGSRDLQASLDWLVVAARQGDAAVSVAEADAFAAQASFYKSLLENLPGGAEGDRWRRALEAASAEAQSARTRAAETFAELAESIESLPATAGATGTMLRQELQAAMSKFAQREVGGSAGVGRGASTTDGNATGGGSTSSPPFESAEEVLAFLQRDGLATVNAVAMGQLLGASSPAGRRGMNALIGMMEVMEPLRSAGLESFGRPFSPFATRFSTISAALAGSGIEASDGASATIGTPNGNLVLLEQDGSWLIDYDSLSTLLPAVSNLEVTTEAARSQMVPLISMFAQRIQDGEFTSAEEADAALWGQLAQLMAAMQGASRR